MRLIVFAIIALTLLLGAMGGGWVKAYNGGTAAPHFVPTPGPTSY